ncbi:MAG: hypothetical protein RL204_2192 [Bacteroidota bacterium]|jgi:hypothetical protein
MYSAEINNNSCIVLNENSEKVGELIYHKRFNRTACDILIDNKKYEAFRKGFFQKNILVMLDGNEAFKFVINSWFGSAIIAPLNYKLKGVSSWTGGTRLIDENDNTLVTIKKAGGIFTHNKFQIEVNDVSVSKLHLLLALYFHIYASHNKRMMVAAS